MARSTYFNSWGKFLEYQDVRLVVVFFEGCLILLCFFVIIPPNKNIYPADGVLWDLCHINHWFIDLLDRYGHFGPTVLGLYCNEIINYFAVLHEL